MARRTSTRNHTVRYIGVYADQTENEPTEFVIPEDLTVLTDEELASLHEQAVTNFDTVYNDGQGLTNDDLTALTALTAGIESITAELASRREAAQERERLAAELAARAHPAPEAVAGGDDDEQPENDDTPDTPDEAAPVVEVVEGTVVDADTPAAVAASGRSEIRVNLGNLRSRQPVQPRPAAEATTIRDVMLASGEGGPFPTGTGVDWLGAGKIIDRRLGSFNQSAYDNAARTGVRLQQQFGVVSIRKPIPADLQIQSGDPGHVDEVLRRAMDESRLPGGSLVAAGGWCAPSEILYGNLLELESRDGLLSVPEVGISRGGIQFTTGVDFWDIYNGTGFDYSEAEDIAGTYVAGTPNTVGDKPCYRVDCPEFQEVRLRTAGLCVTAGLLQQRGYPEVISRTVRGALVAHDHKMSAKVINAMVTGSDAVTMDANTVGTISPLLTSIELQVEHYRYVHRASRGTTLEAVFPYWIRGAVRSDLALRAGVNLLDVTDAQINGWFRSRGINAQYVYDWQAITGDSHDFTAWPATCQFLLYAAGTWVKGTADVITVDTLMDSALLRQNDYIALFTEEAYLVAKMGIDSRVVTVPVCPSGTTGAGEVLTCTGGKAVGDDMARPVAGTLASSAVGNTVFDLTVSGASDAGVGLDAEPYRFSTDGGVTWTEWQTAALYHATGKTLNTDYVARAEVRDKNGNSVFTPGITVHTTG